MLSPEEAWSRLAEAVETMPRRTLRRARREALGATLAEALRATTEVPASDVSAMDGYAVAGDLVAGTELDVAGTVAAGDAPGARLAAGRALRIWTGAPVPAGADRIVPVERTETIDERRVRIVEPVGAAAHIRRRGEILRPGAPLLPAGARLGPAALSLLAGQGVAEVDVVAPPRVAILTTGDEVIPAGDEPRPGQLRDSHTDYLLAAGRRLGLELRSLGIAPDEPAELRRRIGQGLDEAEVVLVCGGVSMGGRDHTPETLAALGATTLFAGVAIQPGKPLLAARSNERLLFGLPGNPASVMIAFRLFVRPVLELLLGREAGFWREARPVELAALLPAAPRRDRFVPARHAGRGVRHELVEPLAVHGSHDSRTFGAADRLLRLRPGEPARQPGDLVEAIDWE